MSLQGTIVTPNCWRVVVWAFSALASTVSATPIGTVTVYARMMPGFKFSGLAYQGKQVEGHAHKKKASEVGASVAEGVQMLGEKIPMIAPLTAPISAGLAAVSSIASWFGFTREAAPQPPQPVAQRLFSNVANCDGPDTSEVVALFPSASTAIDSALGGGEAEDVCAFGSLFARWTLLDIVTINQTSTGVVYTIPVSPFYAHKVLGVCYPMPCGVAGQPFDTWRGTMEYLIYVPSSANVQGTIQVLWDSTPAVNITYAHDPTHTVANAQIDLSGSSKTHIKIGHLSQHPVLLSRNYNQTTVPNFPGELANCNGRLVMRIVAPVTSPLATTTLNILVMGRASENMAFGQPRSVYRNSTTGGISNLDNLVYQGLEGDMARSQEVVLVEDSDYPLVETVNGEEFHSVRPLFQKFSPITQLTSVNAGVALEHYPWPPSGARAGLTWTTFIAAGSASMPFTWVGFMSGMFVGARGSMRIKFTSEVGGVITCSPNYSPALLSPGTLNHIPYQHSDSQSVSLDTGAEFTLPTYGDSKYHLVRDLLSISTGYPDRNRNIQFYMQTSANNNANVFPYIAAGPDYTVTRFRRVPGYLAW